MMVYLIRGGRKGRCTIHPNRLCQRQHWRPGTSDPRRRRGTAYSDQALYTESVHPPGPEQEPRMPLTDPPKRYGTNSGFRLLIGLISLASLSPGLPCSPISHPRGYRSRIESGALVGCRVE